MNPNEALNPRLTIALLENANLLFNEGRYRSKVYTRWFLGYSLQRSYFYGRLDEDNLVALPLLTTEFNSPTDVTLLAEGIVILPKEPENLGDGNIVYKGYGVIQVGNSVVYDGRQTGVLDLIEKLKAELRSKTVIDVTSSDATNGYVEVSEEEIPEYKLVIRGGVVQPEGLYQLNTPGDGQITFNDLTEGEQLIIR